MTTDLTPAAPLLGDLDARLRYAAALADARLLPGPYRRSPADVLLAVEYAAALSIAPTTALTSVHVIDGRPSMSAELMRALVLRDGHRFRVVESTADRCVVEVARRDQPDDRSTFAWTTADAERAGLLPARPRSGWDAYPAAMLLARATSAACRAVFPDVLAGVSYTPDELGAAVDDTGSVVVGTVVRDGDAVDGSAQAPERPAGTVRTRSTYDAVRDAMRVPQHDLPADQPSDAMLRAVNTRLRARGCRDTVHRGWAVAALLDLPAWVESLRSLSRAQVSRLLDLEHDALDGALAATADLAHPDDQADLDAMDDDQVDDDVAADDVTAATVTDPDVDPHLIVDAVVVGDDAPPGPPTRPQLTTDPAPQDRP